MYIYKITNIKSNKVYIGQTNNVIRRFSNHKSKLKRGVHSNAHLQSAWNKYGEEAFKFTILENFNPILNFDINNMEKYYIAKYQATNPEFGYNKKVGGEGGGSPCFETRRKLSKLNKGKKLTEDCKRKMSQSRKGKASPMSGKHHSEITKKLMSKAKTIENGWKPHPNSIKAGLSNLRLPSKDVIQKAREANFKKVKDDLGNVFESITEAAEFHKVHKTNISAILKKRRLSTKGRKFNYVY